MDEASVHVTCGPYFSASPVSKIENCCGTWNHFFEDIKVTAPVEATEIYDIIIYLAHTTKPNTRVCYLRIPAVKALYSKTPDLNIKKYTLIEDIAKDELHDEEFPGILNMRLTLFDRNPPRRKVEDFPDMSRIYDYYETFILRVFLYMARDLPAADDTGLADPFVILRCAGSKTQSITKKETLNPGWFQTLEMEVYIPRLDYDKLPNPSVSILAYDEDAFWQKDLLGRALMDIKGEPKTRVEKGRTVAYSCFVEPQWLPLHFDALNEQKGFVLAGFGLLKKEIAQKYKPLSIIPPTIPCILNIICIGVRDLVGSMDMVPLKRISVKFDVSGDTQEAMDSNKHPVKYNSVDILEILNVPIDIPLDPLYSPVLSVYVYDHVLGILGDRLVGICHIPLEKVVKKRLSSLLEHKKMGKLGLMLDEEIKMNDDDGIITKEEKIENNVAKARVIAALAKLEKMIDKKLVDLAIVDEDTEDEAIGEALQDAAAAETKVEEVKTKGVRNSHPLKNGESMASSMQYESMESEEEDDEESDRFYDEDISDFDNSRTPRSYESEEPSKINGSNMSSAVGPSAVDLDVNADSDESTSPQGRKVTGSNLYSPDRKSYLEKYPDKRGKVAKLRKDSAIKKQKKNAKDRRKKLIAERNAARKQLANESKARKAGIDDEDDGKPKTKHDVENVLSGHGLRKDQVKKRAQQKFLEKQFKQAQKDKEEREKLEKEERHQKRDEKRLNEEKRRKLKTKPDKNVSTNAPDTDPDEDLDMTPEYLRGRETYEDELEDAVIKRKPYFKQNVLHGQVRGRKGWFAKKVANTQETYGIFKCIPKIQTPDYDKAKLQEKYKKYLIPTDMVCRIYFLKGKSLTPNDAKNSDPYLYLKCGKTTIDDSANVIDDTNNPGFYK